VFDRNRTLQYRSRIDDNVNESLVKTRDARSAIEALLAGRRVPVARTVAAGCPTAWLSEQAGHEGASGDAGPVTLDMAGADDLKKLRSNGTDGKVHKLAEFARAKVLAVVFESNHCPVSQLYEGRIEKGQGRTCSPL